MGEKFKERDKGNQRKKRWFPAIDIFEVTDLPTAEELARRQQLHDEQSVSVDTETDKVPQEVVYTSSMSAEKPEAVVGVPNWSGDVSVEDSSSTAVAPEVALQEHIKRNAELRQAEFKRKAQNAVLNHQESRSLEEQELINEREQRRIAIRNKISEEKTNRYNRTVESVIPEKASGTVEAQPLVEDEPNKVKIRFDRSLAQMDRLITSTKKLRQETGLSHKDALVSVENFSEVRSKIREIRSRIKKSQETGQGDIQTLRDELAEHLRAFKKLKMVEKNEPSAVPDVQTPEKIPEVTKTQEKIYEGGDRYRDSVEKYLDSSERSVRSHLSFVPQEWMFFYGQKMTELGSKANEIKKTLADFYENESGGMYGVDHFTDEEKRHIGTLVADFNTILENLVELQTGDEKDKLKESLTVEPKPDGEKKPEASLGESAEKSKPDTNVSSEPAKEASKEADPSVKKESVVLKGRHEYLAIRNEWKATKGTFETEYKKYITGKQNKSAIGKFTALFKKEVKPESLVASELKYNEARKKYVASFGERIANHYKNEKVNDKIVEGMLSLKAGLANRFVLHAAHDRLAIEKEFIPEGRGARVFKDMAEIFKKHKTSIKRVGYITTAVTGLATGGIAVALGTIMGKVVGAKLAGVGAVAGAFAGNALYDAMLLNPREQRLDTAREKAQYTFRIDKLDALEKDYLENYRKYESAVRNKKYAVTGASVLGGVAAGMLTGQFEGPAVVENTPPEVVAPPEIVPPTEIPQDPIRVIPIEKVPEPEPPSPEVPQEPELREEFAVTPENPPLPDFRDDTEVAEPEEAETEEHGEAEEEPEDTNRGGSGGAEGEGNNQEATGEDPRALHAEMSQATFGEGETLEDVADRYYEVWKEFYANEGEDLSREHFLDKVHDLHTFMEEDREAYSGLVANMRTTFDDITDQGAIVDHPINMVPFFMELSFLK